MTIVHTRICMLISYNQLTLVRTACIINGLQFCAYSLQIFCFKDYGLNEANTVNIQIALKNFNVIKIVNFGANKYLRSGIIRVLDGLRNFYYLLQKLVFRNCERH